MLFSSMTFIYIFLPLVCILYLLAKPEIRNHLLLIASIVFYGWGEPRYLCIMLLTIFITYCGALLISKCRGRAGLFLSLALFADLGILVYFKYFNFILENVGKIWGMDVPFLEMIMPIGISFYTFQAMSYLIDVYRGETPPQKDFYKLALYITLFPQLVAGPIVKYHDIAEQLDKRKVSFDKVCLGTKRFILGLSKKILIANVLGASVDKIFALPVTEVSPLTAWFGAISYSLQLYYDFSGYSDMAIGLSLIFGFNIPENFNYPYISKSISEFWRRWHISLSTWFKQYLYIPLGGNRISPQRTYFNLFVVFLATGLWHGASWNFVVWGLWHGMFIIFEKMTAWNREVSDKLINLTKHIYTIFVFVIGWVIFRADNLPGAAEYLKNMFGLIGEHNNVYRNVYFADNIELMMLGIGILCSMPVFRNILQLKYESKISRSLVNIWLIVLFVLSSSYIAASTYNPFIYFRF